MKALETEYKGILFRSRLEARWAVLFDALKLDYVYEPECFVLSNGQKYTPDFYLPKYDFYIEIKPSLEWMKEKYHIGRYDLLRKPLIVLSGSYPSFDHTSWYNGYEMGVNFCPNTKYEPLYFSGVQVGEINTLFDDNDYKEELNTVKAHRFWN